MLEILEQIKDGRGWFWIDAICINQADLTEKSAQIPLMTKIFSWAEIVFACFGAEIPQDFDLIFEFSGLITDTLLRLASESDPDKEYNLDPGQALGPKKHQFYMALDKFMQHMFWNRVW